MKYCDETDRTGIHTPPCTGWLHEGWPWHGCGLNPAMTNRHGIAPTNAGAATGG